MHKSAPASASRLVILHFCRSFDLERVRRGEVGREQLQAGHVTPATILQQMLGQARTPPSLSLQHLLSFFSARLSRCLQTLALSQTGELGAVPCFAELESSLSLCQCVAAHAQLAGIVALPASRAVLTVAGDTQYNTAIADSD